MTVLSTVLTFDLVEKYRILFTFQQVHVGRGANNNIAVKNTYSKTHV